MTLTRRNIGLALVGAGACLLAGPTSRFFGSPSVVEAQEQAPNRREFAVTVRDYRFMPDRIEVMQDDLVKLTLESADVAYSFTIDAYRLSRRIPAGERFFDPGGGDTNVGRGVPVGSSCRRRRRRV